MKSLVDRHGRVVRDLRISVTPRCNYRCFYCDPLGEGSGEPIGTLTPDQVALVVDAAVGLGMTAVRFTGGEPLLRKELPGMLHHAKQVTGLEDVAITTNGSLLARRLPELLEAGLDRVNISLDAVDPQAFRRVTNGGGIKQVWEGIEAVDAAGLKPVKINAVVVRGINDDEVIRLAELTRRRDWHVRFIEYMHLNNAQEDDYHRHFIPGREIRQRIEAVLGGLEPVANDPAAPARLFRVPGWPGALGFINPVSEPFCGACSRMRLTSDGRLRPCLLTDREFDLRPALEAAVPIAAIQEVFLVAAHRKAASGITTPLQRPRTMVAIGG